MTADLLYCNKKNIHPIRFTHVLTKVNVFRVRIILVRGWIDNRIFNPVIIIINGIIIYLCLGNKHWFMVGETLFLDIFPAMNMFMDACQTLCLLWISVTDLIRTCLTTWWLILINRCFGSLGTQNSASLLMISGLVTRSIRAGMNGPGLVDCTLLTYPWGIWTVLEECFSPEIAFHNEKVGWFILVGLTVLKGCRD